MSNRWYRISWKIFVAHVASIGVMITLLPAARLTDMPAISVLGFWWAMTVQPGCLLVALAGSARWSFLAADAYGERVDACRRLLSDPHAKPVEGFSVVNAAGNGASADEHFVQAKGAFMPEPYRSEAGRKAVKGDSLRYVLFKRERYEQLLAEERDRARKKAGGVAVALGSTFVAGMIATLQFSAVFHEMTASLQSESLAAPVTTEPASP